jgi:hypothetical protein
MGKLKEKLLNNLTPEEMDERFEISAFEYVEYMEKYKHLYDDNGNPIPEDVLEQLAIEREKLEKEFNEYLPEFNHEDYIKDVPKTYETGAEFKGGIRVESEWADEKPLSYVEWHLNRDKMAEQFEIDRLNDENKLKYSDNDIKHIIEKFNISNTDSILAELRDIWSKKIGE